MGIREDWNDKILIFDGGMGSLLQGAGLKPGELPETWNIKHSEVLVKIHEDYLNAGANIILSNTFGANRLKYNETAEFNLDEIVDAAMKNARTAVEHCGRGYVALDLGPTGRLLKPMGDLDFEEAVSIYTEVVKAGVRGGADLILIESHWIGKEEDQSPQVFHSGVAVLSYIGKDGGEQVLSFENEYRKRRELRFIDVWKYLLKEEAFK